MICQYHQRRTCTRCGIFDGERLRGTTHGLLIPERRFSFRFHPHEAETAHEQVKRTVLIESLVEYDAMLNEVLGRTVQ